MVYVVMGVSGCGKTSVGRILAKRLAIEFYDADDYHSQENINKMKNFIPLSDEDRIPWLVGLAAHVAQWNMDEGVVLACSALKGKYREILSRDGHEKIVFIYLEGDEKLIRDRIERRKHHFFPSRLLASQLNQLEIPSNAITVNINQTPEEICGEVVEKLASKGLISPMCKAGQ